MGNTNKMNLTTHEEAQIIIEDLLQLINKKDPKMSKELREHFVEVNEIAEDIKTRYDNKVISK